jgi:hypothetical protein
MRSFPGRYILPRHRPPRSPRRSQSKPCLDIHPRPTRTRRAKSQGYKSVAPPRTSHFSPRWSAILSSGWGFVYPSGSEYSLDSYSLLTISQPEVAAVFHPCRYGSCLSISVSAPLRCANRAGVHEKRVVAPEFSFEGVIHARYDSGGLSSISK